MEYFDDIPLITEKVLDSKTEALSYAIRFYAKLCNITEEEAKEYVDFANVSVDKDFGTIHTGEDGLSLLTRCYYLHTKHKKKDVLFFGYVSWAVTDEIYKEYSKLK